MKGLLENWSWNPAARIYFLIIPTAVSIIAAIALYFYFGEQVLWLLLAIPCGFLFFLIYGFVGNKVEKLKIEFANDPGKVVEGLLVVGKFESPGLIILRENELALIPLVGKRVIIPLNEIKILREGHLLPGKLLIGKKAFILKPYKKTRLAFAVTENVGRIFSRKFSAQ